MKIDELAVLSKFRAQSYSCSNQCKQWY